MPKKFYLNVAYDQKEEAKHYGAQWDGKLKKWYYTSKANELELLVRWRDYGLVKYNVKAGCFYIVEGQRDCYKCGKDTTVYGIAIPQKYSFNQSGDYKDEESISLQMVTFVKKISDDALAILKDKAPLYYLDKTNAELSSYYMSHCMHCSAKQGDTYLFYWNETCFNPITKEEKVTASLHFKPVEMLVSDLKRAAFVGRDERLAQLTQKKASLWKKIKYLYKKICSRTN